VKHTLYIVGGLFELFGILLAVSPDLVPGARRLSAWLDPRWRRLENRIRRLLHMRPRPHVVSVGAIASISAAGTVSAIVTVSPETDLGAKVEFLLRRDREDQEAFGHLDERVRQLERESEASLDALRERMETHLAESLNLAASEYRAIRVIGAVALAVGLALATAGNFVS
jgi:hypothetical protein